MSYEPYPRRGFLKSALLGLTLPYAQPEDVPAKTTARLLKIVCVGGHPDDPESGCGGTLARYAEQGHQVTLLYLTRGEAGIPGKTHDEAAKIRTVEALEACKILNAKPLFAGQIDGSTEYNKTRLQEFSKLLMAEKPDIVFTHWPLDSHPDHQVASLLTTNTWMMHQQPFELYFYEVCSGDQTMVFAPTDFVDISTTVEKKKAAFFAHKSQGAAEVYRTDHQRMEWFRGLEAGNGARSGEGFVHLSSRKYRNRMEGLG
jgi:LmbE family N-acetylglucosaminyl deacetylase